MGIFTVRSSTLRPSSADTLRLYDRTGLPAFQLYVGSVDRISTQTIPLDSISLEESGAASPGQLTAAIESTTYAPDALDEVWLEDNLVGRRAFGGYATSRAQTQLYGSLRRTNLTATGYDMALDRIVIPYDYLVSTDDRSMLQYLVSTYGRGLTAPDAFTAVTTFSVPDQELIDVTLRQAIEQILNAAATTTTPYYFVDSNARLNYGLVGPDAPYVVSDFAGTPAGSVGYEAISLDYDDSPLESYVWVSGGTAEGTGWYPSEPPGSGLAFAGVLRQNLSTSPEELAMYGAAYLAKQVSAVRGQIRITGYDGWQPGMTLTLYCQALGAGAKQYLIRGVRHDFLVGTGLRTYTIDFGSLPKSLSRSLAARIADALA